MYTKGDWKLNDTGFTKYTTYRGKASGAREFIVDEELGLIAEVQADTKDEALANAHLIKAAPKLYEALKELLYCYRLRVNMVDQAVVNNAVKVIAEVEDK